MLTVASVTPLTPLHRCVSAREAVRRATVPSSRRAATARTEPTRAPPPSTAGSSSRPARPRSTPRRAGPRRAPACGPASRAVVDLQGDRPDAGHAPPRARPPRRPWTAGRALPRISRASSRPVPETSSGWARIASADESLGRPRGGRHDRRRNARASPISEMAITGAPQPSTPTAATGSPARSSTAARQAFCSGWSGRQVVPIATSRAARQVSSMPVCLPEQFMQHPRRPAARRAAPSARARLVQRQVGRAAQVRLGQPGRRPAAPAPASTWNGSPEWLAATRARSAGSARRRPDAQHRHGLHRLVGRAREDRPVRDRRPRPPALAGRVHHRDRAAVAALDETRSGPPRRAARRRRTRRVTVAPGRSPSRRRASAGVSGGRWASRANARRARHELGVALDRLALGVGDGVLHADPQVTAGRRARRAAPAAWSGRCRWPRTWCPSGRSRSACCAGDQRLGGARHAAGHPHDEVDVHVAAGRQPVLVQQASRDVRWPRSKISYSGTMPRSCIRVCSSTMNSHRLRNTSSPKLTVPMVHEAISGPASSTASRAASGSVTAPPEESWTIRSVESRSAATVSRAAGPGRGSAWPSSSRMWTWITLAPTASHSFAVATSSSRVTGSAGHVGLGRLGAGRAPP